MKQRAVIELHFLPSIQYLSKFLLFDEILLEKHEHYGKGSYRNRCKIAAANGLQRLSIPLKKGKNEGLNIRQVEIAYEENWQGEHWVSIRSAYGNAPYYDYYADELEKLLKQKTKYLFDYNLDLLNKIIELIDCKTEIGFTNHWQNEIDPGIVDLRNTIHPKAHRAVLDESFQATKYPQVFEEKAGFLPNLSILDLLFCTGPESFLILKKCVLNDFSSAKESK